MCIWIEHTHTYIHLVKNIELKKAQETLAIIRGVFFFPTLCCLILFF